MDKIKAVSSNNFVKPDFPTPLICSVSTQKLQRQHMALMTRKASVLSQIEDRKRLYIPSTDCQVMVMVMLAYRSPSFTYTISARRNLWVYFIPNLNCKFLSDVVVIRLVLK